MSEPRPIEEFAEVLAADPEIQSLIDTNAGETLEILLESGEIADRIQSSGSESTVIEASGGGENHFEVRIENYGPIYWISANEFDDIGYFDSELAAESHAREVYEAEIAAAEEEEEEEEEEL